MEELKIELKELKRGIRQSQKEFKVDTLPPPPPPPPPLSPPPSSLPPPLPSSSDIQKNENIMSEGPVNKTPSSSPSSPSSSHSTPSSLPSSPLQEKYRPANSIVLDIDLGDGKKGMIDVTIDSNPVVCRDQTLLSSLVLIVLVGISVSIHLPACSQP